MDAININSIVIGARFRKDRGDLAPLIDSIRKVGLLHPIVVGKDHNLIAGRRRLEACKELGWTEIPAHVVSVDDPRLAEADENRVRLDFSPSEALAVAEHFEGIEREKAKERKRSTLKRGNKAPDVQTLHDGDKGKSREKAAAVTGYSHETLRKAKAVKEAAEKEPEKYQRLVDEMDKTGKVDPAYKKLAEGKPKKARRSASDVSIDIAKHAYIALHPKERKIFRKWLRTVD